MNVKLLAATSIGTGLEFFDFSVFLLFASYISEAFFSHLGVSSLIPVLLFYGVGYLARPMGGVLCGHLGDRYGRKTVFMLTILVTSLSTLLIGLLPTYERLGGVSIVLLVALRVCQGLALGGEFCGSMIYAAESVAFHRRGWVVSVVGAGGGVGFIAGATIGWYLVEVLSLQDMQAWGWRVPFILGGCMGLLGMVLRRRLLESPVFRDIQEKQVVCCFPLRTVLTQAWRQVLMGICLTPITGVACTLFFYLPTYFKAHEQKAISFTMSTVGFAIATALFMLFGMTSDRIGRRRQLEIGAMAMLVTVLLASIALSGSEDITMAWGLVILFALVSPIVTGCCELGIAELFPTSIRYSGMALAQNLGFVLFSGFMPFVFNRLLTVMGLMEMIVWVTVSASILVLLSCRYIAKDAHRLTMNEVAGEVDDWNAKTKLKSSTSS